MFKDDGRGDTLSDACWCTWRRVGVRGFSFQGSNVRASKDDECMLHIAVRNGTASSEWHCLSVVQQTQF